MELDKLKKKRKPLRAALTRVTNKIQDVQKEDPGVIDRRLLKQWSKSLQENFEAVKALDEEILNLLLEKEIEDAEYEKRS